MTSVDPRFDRNSDQSMWDISSIRPSTPPTHEIVFSVGDNTKEIIRFCENGDIMVKGKLITNDIELVVAMREFLAIQGILKQDLRYHAKQAIDGSKI